MARNLGSSSSRKPQALYVPLAVGDTQLHLNQRPLRPERSGCQSQPLIVQEFSELLSAVCTRVCTNNPNTGHAETLESLAAALREALSTSECCQLAELLANHQMTATWG